MATERWGSWPALVLSVHGNSFRRIASVPVGPGFPSVGSPTCGWRADLNMRGSVTRIPSRRYGSAQDLCRHPTPLELRLSSIGKLLKMHQAKDNHTRQQALLGRTGPVPIDGVKCHPSSEHFRLQISGMLLPRWRFSHTKPRLCAQPTQFIVCCQRTSNTEMHCSETFICERAIIHQYRPNDQTNWSPSSDGINPICYRLANQCYKPVTDLNLNRQGYLGRVRTIRAPVKSS